MKITIFRDVREIYTPYYLSLEKVIDRIKHGNSRDLLEKIRDEPNKEARGKLKTRLPSILFSGDFPNRKTDAIPNNHSGLVVLDIDDLGQKSFDEVNKIIQSDKHTLCSFVSPSGNGFKVLVKIPADIKRHVGYWSGLEDYYLSKHEIKLDPTGKNIGRVCYESYDPDVFFNSESEVFKKFIEPLKTTSKSKDSVDVFAIKSDDKIIEKVRVWWAKKYDFNSGRNDAIFHLASALNRFGVSFSSTLSFCSKYEDYSRSDNPFTAKEIERTVNNVYTHQSHKHGSETLEDSAKKKTVADQIMGAEPEQAGEMLSDIEGFEYFSPTELEAAAVTIKEEVKAKKNNNRVFWFYDDGKLKIDVKAMIDFINGLGYYVYYPSKTPNSYVFIKIENSIIKLVDEREIKSEVLEFVNSKKQNVVYNLISDRVKYWQKSFLNALPVIDPPILRDIREVSFIPTPSGVYRVTKYEIKKIDYVDLREGYVWDSQITKKDFNYLGSDKAGSGDFAEFVSLVGGPKADRLYTIIGYLLHTFKDPARSKAVFLYDKNLTQINGEPEGGSGKGLIIEGIKKIREVATTSGDRVDFKKQFALQEVTEGTQIIWVDELPQKVDMHSFFSRITNGMPIEKKNLSPIFIENDKSPKFAFTTNFKPKGSSGSHKRRRIDFSVTDYFNSENEPRQMFGKSFFNEWNKNEWDLFFSFYLECLKEYLASGIIQVEDKDDLYLTILSECGYELTNFWIDEGHLNNVILAGKFNARQYYEKIMHDYELRGDELSVKKYLVYTRKILKLHSINTTESGNRKELEFIIL